jgi:hypothetical protein
MWSQSPKQHVILKLNGDGLPLFPFVPPLSSTCAAEPDPLPPDKLPPFPLLGVAFPLLPLPVTASCCNLESPFTSRSLKGLPLPLGIGFITRSSRHLPGRMWEIDKEKIMIDKD